MVHRLELLRSTLVWPETPLVVTATLPVAELGSELAGVRETIGVDLLEVVELLQIDSVDDLKNGLPIGD
jgi:hypothetical protein